MITETFDDELEPAEIEQSSLTDWTHEPTISDLQTNLDDAEVDHGLHTANVDRWLENRNMEGKAKPPQIKGKSKIAPKVIRKQAEWRYSALAAPFLSTEDVYNVAPKTAGDKKRAQQNASILNHQFNTEISKVSFINSYVRDAVDIGTVIVEVGWEFREEEVTDLVKDYEYVPSKDPELQQKYTNLLQLKAASADAYNEYMNPGLDGAVTLFATTGALFEAVETGEHYETRMIEAVNRPTVEVCKAANILIDPSCEGDLSKAKFVIKRSKSSYSELKADGRYKNLDDILISAADVLANPDFKDSVDIQSFSFKDKARKQFVVTDYWGDWDIDGSGITTPIIATWVGNVMIRLEKNYFPFKRPPFAMATYMPKRDSVYGEPDGELLEENQQIIGATVRGAVDLMGKSANGQTGMQQGMLDAVNKRKYMRGENYEYTLQGDPRTAIHQHTYPELPQSVFSMINYQNADAESLTGVKAFSSGINSQALGDSVGGGRDAMDAASKREYDILMRLAEGIKHIGWMITAMNAEWLSEEEVIRITDEKFVTVRRDDLAGKFDISLSISTAEEDNQKASELSFMLQTIGNNMDPGLQNVILGDIAQLRKMPTLAKRIREYKPEPDPMVQYEQQLNIKLLEAQIAKEMALTAKHNAEATANAGRNFKDIAQGELNQAKIGTEEAKGRNLHSDSDGKDLSYVDKASGAEHQRQLQLEDNKAANSVAVSKEAAKDKTKETTK